MAISKIESVRTDNIDNMLDSLIQIQKENGVESKLREAIFDPKTNQRVNVYRRKELERKGVDTSDYINSPVTKESKCKKCPKAIEKGISNIARGIFVYNESDLIEDSGEMYICEYCTDIGRDNKYRPDKCDTCTSCIECNEYIGNTCDGCGYSTLYNEGSTYGELTNQNNDDFMKDEDRKLFVDIESDKPEFKRFEPTGGFTINDY